MTVDSIMDWGGRRVKIAELVLDYINVLVWPLVIGVAFFLFRKQIAEVVRRITHVKLPGAELDLIVQEVTDRTTEYREPTETATEQDSPGFTIREVIRRDPTLGMAQLRIQ